MKRSPINPVGKVGRRRAAKRKKINPALCERAGGTWEMNEFGHQYCSGMFCEMPRCGNPAVDGAAHIEGRGQCGADTLENLIVLCKAHHDLMDSADAETREKTRQRAKQITGGEK